MFWKDGGDSCWVCGMYFWQVVTVPLVINALLPKSQAAYWKAQIAGGHILVDVALPRW